ncbi:heterokaryon incompatibility protein-domain-containing protein [Phaeosphaeriaceae sp. PMI808]|nr:heterokaryon incompatibility protein-domain-containing protein [Phaeosphaeriaceae sp. PMI808]
MSERPVPKFDTIHSLGVRATAAGKKSPRRPPGLILDKREGQEIEHHSAESFVPLNCGICTKSLASNPRLCDDCQVWNDACHVFECLKGDKGYDDHWKLPALTLQQVLNRKNCILCQALAENVLRFFESHTALKSEGYLQCENDEQEEILQVEVKNYGPYCLGQGAHDEIALKLLRPHGRQLEYQDSLPSPLYMTDAERQGGTSTVKVVLFLCLISPKGSTLHHRYPELDSYKNLETTAKPAYWSDKFNPGSQRVQPNDDPGCMQPTFGAQVTLHYANNYTGLVRVDPWDQTFIDTPLLCSWLKLCTPEHGPKCNLGPNEVPLPSGFKAIDTYRLCIVDLPSTPHPSYATLSYTWGATSGIKELQLEKANKNDLSKEHSLKRFGGIPDVILDAITLCANMRVQYLWVDRLCIVQDDLEAKMHHINAMDRIYNMAFFTIVAAVPLGVGLPGLRGRPRKPCFSNYTRRFHPKLRFISDNFHTVLNSFWNTRGWTYQERLLSRRLIYITEWQAFFVCNARAEQEEVGEIASTVNPYRHAFRFTVYAPLVGDYTARNLSFESDILNAFAGLGKQFEEKSGKPMLYGLPERYFVKALLWENAKDISRRGGVPDVPTWAWGAWSGQTKYDLNSRVEKLSIGTLVRFYYCDPIHGLRHVEADEVWFFQAINLYTLTSLPVIDPLYPEMRFMPDSEGIEEAWRACPQNPYTVTLHDRGEDATFEKALQHLGSLVFNTTSASISLRLPTTSRADFIETPGFIKLEIVNSSDVVIGQMAQLPSLWIEQHLDLNVQHEIIVLAAGIVSESFRYAQTHSTVHTEGYIQAPRSTESFWYLHVMLIKRDENGIAQRVAIGTVEMGAWRDCAPRWCTIILT